MTPAIFTIPRPLQVLTCSVLVLQAAMLLQSGPFNAVRLAVASEQFSPVGIEQNELEAYARAKPQVEEIKDFWEGPISSSNTSAAKDLREVREREIERTVGLEGLSLDRYQEIDAEVEQSRDLQETVNRLAQD